MIDDEIEIEEVGRMRIGKHELAILEYLGKHSSDDNWGPNYKGIRNIIGLGDTYNPDEIERKAKHWVYERARDDNPISFKFALKWYKQWYWYTPRVKFSQAMNRLIKKGLVVRQWDILVETGSVRDVLSSAFDGSLYAGETDELTDVPRVTFSADKFYKLTRTGREELNKRRRRLE